ncbi:MAG: hypothetical protein JO245_05080 [Pseudolabrys sp.]|nr:hypothetical protein [Pseudolabrys sp.]
MGKPKIAAIEDSAQQAASEPLLFAVAQFIPTGARVGIAGTPLSNMLPPGCAVTPHSEADIIAAIGVLEGAENREQFFGSLALMRRPIVIDYRPQDFGGGGLSLYDLTQLFDRFGYRVECSQACDGGALIMRLAPAEKFAASRPPRVAVLSLGDPRGLGERLGYHMVHSVMPGAADIAHLSPQAATEDVDLLIMGTGGALGPTHLTEELFATLDRARTVVGIFGTYYRPLIPRHALDRLIERCDTWYARHEEDLFVFGNGLRNVVHLGDWRIDACPLGRATDEEPLDIGPERLRAMTTDAAIDALRRHRTVTARDPSALLCALTAADVVTYAGAVEENRSLLMDIFGRSFADGVGFVVDRDAVARYKTRVRDNVAAMRERLAATLTARSAAA